jgi:DNA segregation ATPase FtsK/SpoIIIE-like protein
MSQDAIEKALYSRALELVREKDACISISLFQRKMSLGYTVAARLMDRLEQDGIVSPYAGAKPRTLLENGRPMTHDDTACDNASEGEVATS